MVTQLIGSTGIYSLPNPLNSGFGGLVVSMVPEFAGSNPAETAGFFGCPNNPQHAFLRMGSERICPKLIFAACKRT